MNCYFTVKESTPDKPRDAERECFGAHLVTQACISLTLCEKTETNNSSNKILDVCTFTVITLLLSLQVGLNVRDM